MREYLLGFFKEFEYDAKDAERLISAYDNIVANEAANKLLAEALAAYEADFMLNCADEILTRANAISAYSAIHPYTVKLLTFICMTKHLKRIYIEKGLDMQIYKDSVLDLKWKLEECKAVKGICGTFVEAWFGRFLNLKLFALGRLQFEISFMKMDYEKNGIKLEKGKSKVINVHIPRTGTPLDKESCDRSYALAREFFKDEVGDVCAFVCLSWLLFPRNKDILPTGTNTRRFMSEFEIIDWGFNEGQDLWRLFDTHELNPERLPVNGSFRRCYVEYLKNGGRVGWGYGIKF